MHVFLVFNKDILTLTLQRVCLNFNSTFVYDKYLMAKKIKPFLIIGVILGMIVIHTQSIVVAAILLTGTYFINTKEKLVFFSSFSKRSNHKINN